ncbi:uncharacterized protein EI97DRAFT_397817 [Westerdykella ornata]|uniref:Uncharacterized protein n=1 Tax=Westerdykella ornata TaxID=318751 RepID=A0A6A6JPH2_WESOR|nr:uncharacterized protein EI97DRAFT_397817 [Westerdykella ornata]KAF2276849.1 hypothetical protein EI97DRAFT_397817 [Westerdykella ornata]
MQLLRAIRVASLALTSFPLGIHAQVVTSNQNLTLRFFQSDQQDSCDYANSNRALTFTTSSIPVLGQCFDFVDLFSGNATQGFINQTRNQGQNAWGEAGIHWQLENTDTFDPQANYSRVLYRQHITNPTTDEQKPGHYADRQVTIYGGPKCTEADPNSNTTLFPWYGFSCWSEDKGSCGTLPYKIASFYIRAGKDEQSQGRMGTCWVFAECGAATSLLLSSRAMVGAFISASLAIWLSM